MSGTWRGKREWMVGVVASVGLAVSLLGQGVEQARTDGRSRARLVVEKESVTVQRGEAMLGRYRYEGVAFKPYLERLCTPGGVNVLRDGPTDHKHHHGLMYGVTVDGVNFWEEGSGAGKEVGRWLGPVAVREQEGLVGADFGVGLNWMGTEERPMLREWRQVGVYSWGEMGATLAVWQSRLGVGRGRESATLTGAHYHGLGMRLVASMDKGGVFMNAAGEEGEVVRGTERLVRGSWCAYTAAAEGREVTVAMFAGPGNVREATWFMMTEPFAYLSATLNTYREPLVVERGKALSLCYGVVLWDGRVERARIEKAYTHWQSLARDLAGPMTRRSN